MAEKIKYFGFADLHKLEKEQKEQNKTAPTKIDNKIEILRSTDPTDPSDRQKDPTDLNTTPVNLASHADGMGDALPMAAVAKKTVDAKINTTADLAEDASTAAAANSITDANLTAAAKITADAKIDRPTSANLAAHATQAEVTKQTYSAKSATAAKITPAPTPAKQAAAVTLARVQGELRVPNTVVDSLLPMLEPTEAIVYFRLYRLSHGYHKETCTVGIEKLARSVNCGERTVYRAIAKLESLGFIKREGASFAGEIKGNHYRVVIPAAAADLTTDAKMAGGADLAQAAQMADNKKNLKKINKNRLQAIINQYLRINLGRSDYKISDLSDDVKIACAREGLIFDPDLFNDLIN